MLKPGRYKNKAGAVLGHAVTRADRAEAAIERVREIHERGRTQFHPAQGLVSTEEDNIEDGCTECQVEWPCATIEALQLSTAPQPKSGRTCTRTPGGRPCENTKPGHALHWSNGPEAPSENSNSAFTPLDEAALRQVIHAANIRWQAEYRREPIADAITRAVVEHLKGGV